MYNGRTSNNARLKLAPLPQDSGSPEQHLLTVWDSYVRSAAATDVAIVAHSFGGVVTVNLVRGEGFMNWSGGVRVCWRGGLVMYLILISLDVICSGVLMCFDLV